ncbi:TraM recognition domain-containing protein [Pseudonocardia nematodicida]|uniref:TraM recognition domain-containing protein n=1 Tax=Pseudonocardia nematodicida TaxID=1206997 RepID=A0ABV1KEI4_9PSEU
MTRGVQRWAGDIALPATALGLVAFVVLVVEMAAVATGLVAGAPRLLILGFDDTADLLRSSLGTPPPSGSPIAHLAEHSTLFLGCVITTAATFGLAVAAIGRWWWRRWGPTKPGHATRAEIRAELSLQACRRAALRLRPSLTAAEIRSAPPGDVGIPLPEGPTGSLWAPLETTTGTLAPTQTGKSRRWLTPLCLEAPGALLCSTTKPDLLMLTALARSRRAMPGPILVFDLTGTVNWPAKLHWSLLGGCDDDIKAWSRARILVEASSTAVETGDGRGSGNDRVFRQRAVGVVGAYLLAASVSGAEHSRVVAWATDREAARSAVTVLQGHERYEAYGHDLQAELNMVAQTADAVWLSVRRALAPFADRRIRELCTEDAARSYDVERFIASGGSLYLIAEENDVNATPVMTTIVAEWIDTARAMGLRYPSKRLDPPATAVLDELPAATPVPDLPTSQADSLSRGVIIHWAAQSKAQLETTYGRQKAVTLLDNSALMGIWGGLKDPATLQWLSSILGEHDRTRLQEPADGVWSGARGATRSLERVHTYQPADVRTLERGQVLLVFRHLLAIRARTVDPFDRPDGLQLRRDVDAIETGRIPIDARGFPIAGIDRPPPAHRPSPRIPGWSAR